MANEKKEQPNFAGVNDAEQQRMSGLSEKSEISRSLTEKIGTYSLEVIGVVDQMWKGDNRKEVIAAIGEWGDAEENKIKELTEKVSGGKDGYMRAKLNYAGPAVNESIAKARKEKGKDFSRDDFVAAESAGLESLHDEGATAAYYLDKAQKSIEAARVSAVQHLDKLSESK